MSHGFAIVTSGLPLDLFNRDAVVARLDEVRSLALATAALSSHTVSSGKFMLFLLSHGLPKSLLLLDHGRKDFRCIFFIQNLALIHRLCRLQVSEERLQGGNLLVLVIRKRVSIVIL